jgi:hypothetical protein
MTLHDDGYTHMVEIAWRPNDPALCGVRWVEGSDDPADVTCPVCLEMMEEKKATK